MKSRSSIPASLRYLQPFADELAKLPPNQLNEDLDPAELDPRSIRTI
jgi:hypothetical protein